MFDFLLFSLIILTFLSISLHGFSYPSNGNWEFSKSPDIDCGSHFLCSPSNFTWHSDSLKYFYNNENACAELEAKGIKKIYFHGDSFMRQMYAALMITLSNNYRNGSLAQTESAKDCEYNRQFNEKYCGTRQLNHYGILCNGNLILDPLLNGIHDLKHCSTTENNILFWSFGNYKTTRNGRHGVNNATAYAELFENEICPKIKENTNKFCKIVWISTHYRVVGHFPDEKPEIIQTYNEGMREFFESGRCGPVHYIDVYNMTKSLVTSGAVPTEAYQAMTYDSVHWGMEVNLLKAQILLNAILQSDY